MSVQRRVRRPKISRPLSLNDWEKQNEVLARWNDELCSGESLPEVEIISLLEEQIPRYKLRADTLTKFGGYENQDWFIPSPALQIDEADLKLSPDQIRETLNYFLLCSNRVSQMTKTYDDIEAVTRLLEEKEKDLELTARIGKELLNQNNKLESNVETLQTDLKNATDKITQLTHEISKKAELIQILTNDMDESTLESVGLPGRINLELMQKKISTLEDENKSLKCEYVRLASDTDKVEEHEQRLILDITGQLACANSNRTLLEDEVDRLKDENKIQHEQILALTASLQEAHEKLQKCLRDNEQLRNQLHITKENQGSLAVELSEFKGRYYEVEALLQDAQEQLRKLRRRQMPMARCSNFPSLGANNQVPFDSLQSELEMSMHSELSTDSGIANVESVPQYKRVFETVRCASQNSLSSADSMGSLNSGLGAYMTSAGTTGGPRMSVRTQGCDLRRSSGSIYSSSSLGYPSLDSTGQSDNESLQTDSEDGYPGPPCRGVPGAPGAADLEAALRRLTPSEVLERRANLQHGATYGGYEGDTFLPFGCRTPDSLMSTGSLGYPHWKLPEKLQIVKPLEGSQTLHHWSQLAQPTFGGLLEERPGVKIKGGKELEDMGLESYGLSDLEEDEEFPNPGKVFEISAPTYTLTNSTVMHPDDGTFVTPSNRASRVASVCSSIQNSPPQTPSALSRRNSTTTFSTTYGLAKMLNERGIKAVTPSAYNTPCGVNSFTPTATPCNSPDGTPLPSRSGSPEPYEQFSIPQLILSSMPFLKQTVGVGGAKKKQPVSRLKRAKPEKESLVGKIEKIGLGNLMGTPGGLSLSAGMYSRPALTSPMAQLTCLLPSHSRSIENLNSVSIKQYSDRVQKETKKQSSPVKPPSSLGVPGKPGGDSLNKRLEQLNARKQRRQGHIRLGNGGGIIQESTGPGSMGARSMRQGSTRPDLGTVRSDLGQVRSDLGTVAVKSRQEPEHSTTLGTLSSLLFGRKGGLF